jgi:hypothetical protein
MEAGSDVRIRFLGHALGFTVRVVHVGNRLDHEQEASSACAVCEAMQDGAIVLCRSWPLWSIVTRWEANAQRPSLVGPEGSEDLRRFPPNATMYVLQRTSRALTNGEAIRAAMHFGAEVAAEPGGRRQASYGGKLYDAWSVKLGNDTFCPQCGPDEWQCAHRTATRARGTQLAAVRFLNDVYTALQGNGQREDLRNAACTFAAMASELKPYVQGDFAATWHDARGRAQYAASVARLTELHRRAADHMQAAADDLRQS